MAMDKRHSRYVVPLTEYLAIVRFYWSSDSFSDFQVHRYQDYELDDGWCSERVASCILLIILRVKFFTGAFLDMAPVRLTNFLTY